jgi:hypothetical protein
VTRADDTFTRADLELLHRALAYRRKRIHEQGAAVRVQGLLDRVETLLLGGSGPPLRLSPPEQDVLLREIPLYCEELTRRGGSEAGAAEARRLREMMEPLAGGLSLQAQLKRWWRRVRGH